MSARIRLVEGDITAEAADAIVNAANDRLWMGAGVAGAIKRAGGPDIEREAMALGPIAVGDAVVTGAGSLAARHVIHAAVMGQDLRTDAEKIRRATESALRCANELVLHSVALPALGTGVGGFPLRRCAEVMLEAVSARVRSGSSLEEVVFVLRGAEAFAAFRDALGGDVGEVG